MIILQPSNSRILLDDYCLETFWTVKDSQDSIWYSEGPYDCNPWWRKSSKYNNYKRYLFRENECYTLNLTMYMETD